MEFELRKPGWADVSNEVMNLEFIEPGGRLVKSMEPADLRALFVFLGEHLAQVDPLVGGTPGELLTMARHDFQEIRDLLFTALRVDREKFPHPSVLDMVKAVCRTEDLNDAREVLQEGVAATTPAEIVCVKTEIRTNIECAGPLVWEAAYFVRKEFGGAEEVDVRGPMCYPHAAYEQNWTQGIGAIRYAIARKISEGKTT